MFRVEDYASDTQTQFIGDSSILVSRISTDSRDINKGDLYVALKGLNFDGHDFIFEAFERGATVGNFRNLK